MRTLPNIFTERRGLELRYVIKLNGSYYTDDAILNVSQIAEDWSPTSMNFSQVTVTVTFDVPKPLPKEPCSLFLEAKGDMFEVLRGEVNSPITVDEAANSFSFAILSKIESLEIGFSPEESNLDFVSKDLEGNAWPIVIGSVVQEPLVKIQQSESITVNERFTIVDPTLYHKRRLAKAYYDNAAFQVAFWQQTMNDARNLAENASTLIDRYVTILNVEDIKIAEYTVIKETLEELREREKQEPNDQDIKDDIDTWEEQLNIVAPQGEAALAQKEIDEKSIEENTYRIRLYKEASRNLVRAHNLQRQYVAQVKDIDQQICLQSLHALSSVAVIDTEEFEKDTPTDVTINGVQFNVTVDDEDIMTINGSNTPFYTNVGVEPWAIDDEPCSDIPIFNGVDMFRITDPTVDLTDKWIRVKRRNSDQRHFVKVREQRGNKIYFDLVEWDRQQSSGYPRNTDIDDVANNLAQFIADTVFPNQHSTPTGDWSPDKFNQLQAQQLQTILASLVEPPNAEELQYLARLVAMLPYDDLDKDQLFDSSLLNNVVFEAIHPRQIYTIVGEDIESIEEVRGLVPDEWLDYIGLIFEEIPGEMPWAANVGDKAVVELCDIYIANIFPSTVVSLQAEYTDQQEATYLATIPEYYYTVLPSHNLGSLDVTAIVMNRRLGPNWGDTIYGTIESSVSDNIVEAIDTLASKFINTPINADNKAALVPKLETYSANCVLRDRRDTLQVCQELARQFRCGLILSLGELKIRYLSETPTSVMTLSTDTYVESSFTKHAESTEILSTVINATWRQTGYEKDLREHIQRYNVDIHGRHLQNMNMYAVNRRDWVEKTVTFELIRRANVYQYWSVTCDLRALGLEMLDAVTLDGVLCTVVDRTIDVNVGTVRLTLATPIRQDETTPYPYYWPSSLTPGTEWPDEETNTGVGRGVTGSIPCP